MSNDQQRIKHSRRISKTRDAEIRQVQNCQGAWYHGQRISQVCQTPCHELWTSTLYDMFKPTQNLA
jgi:hypothetical protein